MSIYRTAYRVNNGGVTGTVTDYDTYHFETDSEMVLMGNGQTLEEFAQSKIVTVYNKGAANEQVVTKWANGEMEIKLVQTPNNININQNYGGFKISDVIPQVNFKEKFVGTPVVTPWINGRSTGCRVWLIHDWNISVNSNSTMSLLACSGENVSNLTLRIGYIAKGWWK